MSVIAFLLGIAIPALVGWLALDLCEGKTRVLWRAEKWAIGFLLGGTLSMFVAFLLNLVLGLPFSLWGFAVTFVVLIVAFGLPWLWKQQKKMARSVAPGAAESTLPRRSLLIALCAFGTWVALRILAFTGIALLTPTYFDDALDNWNLRGKIFFEQGKFTLAFPWDANPGVSSYPPSVSLMKTWLSTLAGSWNEGLANILHPLWFIALLGIVYWTLRRKLSWAWSAFGALLLASLPLELIHGTAPYADVFLSAHVFVTAAFLYNALTAKTAEERKTWLRLEAFALALVILTKNEGWALYFPVLLVLTAAALTWMIYEKQMTQKETTQSSLLTLGLAALVAIPWIGFKMVHGLAFGNAKGIDLNFVWQKGVLLAVGVNTFFEGNWALLFPLFFLLLILRWKQAFKTPLLVFTACFLLPYLGQLFLYMWTGLSTEVLMQTGYARGLVHLTPAAVTLTTFLLHEIFSKRSASVSW